MARRPDREKAEVLNEKNPKQLRHSLAHLSVTAVPDFYEQAYQDWRLVYNRLPSPRKIQTLVAGVEAIMEMALTSVNRSYIYCDVQSDYARPKPCRRFASGVAHDKGSSPLFILIHFYCHLCCGRDPVACF
jgi:hypothetical protein